MGASETKYIAIDDKKCQYPTDGDDGEFDGLTADKKKSDPYVYPRSEFNAMDHTGKGKLTTSEFEKLILFLGHKNPDELLKRVDKSKDGYMSLTEYLEAMTHLNEKEQENWKPVYRDMFKKMDKSGDATAPKKDVINAFKEMGFDIDDEFREKINAMDENKDGNISYVEFLRAQLKQKHIIP